MQDSSRSRLKKDVLEKKILVAWLEIALYALLDDFVVHVDGSGQIVEEQPYRVTRNRKAYEYSEAARSRYKQLVSPTGMYNIIKRHLNYERRQLECLEADFGEPIQFKDKKLTRYGVILKSLRNSSGANTLLELQPRWARRSDDEDELYEEAVSLVARTQIADATLIRDNLSIGQSQANLFMKRLEDEGLVSKLTNPASKRAVFITVDDMDAREAKDHANK